MLATVTPREKIGNETVTGTHAPGPDLQEEDGIQADLARMTGVKTTGHRLAGLAAKQVVTVRTIVRVGGQTQGQAAVTK